MKILFISNHYPPYEIGGYEQLCRDMVVRLTARGHQAQIMTSTYGVSTPVSEEGIQRVLHIQPDYRAKMGPAAQFFLTRRRYEAADLEQVRMIARRFAPDVVFMWNLEYLPRTIATLVEAMPGVAVAHWIAGRSPAGPDEFEEYWRHRASQTIRRWLKQPIALAALTILKAEGKPVKPQLKHVAVVSHYMREQGLADGTLPPQTQVIYNGVEVEQFYRPVSNTPHNRLVLLQAGRVSADKGVHVAIEAMHQLTKMGYAHCIQLNIAGSGPAEYLDHLRALVAGYGLDTTVNFLGRLPREKMPTLMSAADVLLLPTNSQEPFARVVLEAMASGLVVVGALTGGTGEIIQHEQTGLTFPAGDSAALAAAIARLIDKQALRAQLATRGQQRVLADFSLEKMTDRCEQLLTAACTER